MNNRTFKNIFSLMLTSVLMMVGCGGSSSNNPVSTGNVNGGLVNVSGRVSNLSGSGRVSFYTPTAAVKNGMSVTNSSRASVSNNGVYTFYTDEKGNYSGTISEGEYYVTAQNSDGTMKSVPTKQRFSASARADEASSGSEYTKVDDIILAKIQDIHGSLVTSSIGLSCASIPVFIENTPYVAITNSSGDFTFNSVPIGTYTFSANIDAEKFRYHFSNSVNSNQLNTTIPLMSYDTLSLTGSSVIGVVVDNNDNSCKGKLIMAVLESGEIYSALSDTNGSFVMPFSLDNQSITWLVDMQNITPVEAAEGKVTFRVISGSSSSSSSEKYTILINEEITSDSAYPDGSFFSKTGSTTLFIYKEVSDGQYEMINSSRVYLPLENYPVSNLEKGKYFYALRCDEEGNGFYGIKISEPFDVENDLLTLDSSSNIVSIMRPKIIVEESGYYKYNCLSNTSGSLDVTEFIYARYEGETDDIELSLSGSYGAEGSDHPYMALIDLTKLNGKDSGIYNIYTGYTVSYNGFKATITSDPYPYVKH